MRIGIDISQMVYKNTGVANYLKNLVTILIDQDSNNEYVFFFSSLRGTLDATYITSLSEKKNVTLRQFTFPPVFLDLLWNKLHIVSIEKFIGDVDVFISSDWTQPPVKRAKNVTILYDLIVYKFPNEMDQKIVMTQKRKLHWVKKECDAVICISDATKKDAKEILNIAENKLSVVYPGFKAL